MKKSSLKMEEHNTQVREKFDVELGYNMKTGTTAKTFIRGEAWRPKVSLEEPKGSAPQVGESVHRTSRYFWQSSNKKYLLNESYTKFMLQLPLCKEK